MAGLYTVTVTATEDGCETTSSDTYSVTIVNACLDANALTEPNNHHFDTENILVFNAFEETSFLEWDSMDSFATKNYR